MPKVQVYTMQSCPFCVAAKTLLKQRAIPFDEIVLSEDDDAAWDALYKKSRMQTVPQIFFGERLIGGFKELAEEDKKTTLAGLK